MLNSTSAGTVVTAPVKQGASGVGLRAEIITDITQISPEEWSRVYPKILENYSFFKTLQESGLEQFEWHYILIYDARELVGIAPCFLMHYPLDTTIQGPIKSILLPSGLLELLFHHVPELNIQ